MTQQRWQDLMNSEEPLTQEELNQGWHFCAEMDGLLANSKNPDGDCFCDLNKTRTAMNNPTKSSPATLELAKKIYGIQNCDCNDCVKLYKEQSKP